MQQAKYLDWLVSLLGACAIALALGLLLPGLRPGAPYLLVIGVLMHGYGMFKMYVKPSGK